jgi:mono/diheme cytochrome c family protein
MMAYRLGTGILLLGFLALGVSLSCGRLSAQAQEARVAQGKQLFADKGCYGCHTIGAEGTPIGSDLRGTAERYREVALARWLLDPAAQAPTRHMPNLGLSEAEANALAAYIASLR